MKIATALLVCAAASAAFAAWPQFGRDPQHTGSTPVTAQSLGKVLAQIVMDPFVSDEISPGGSLFVHYAAPLIDGNELFVELKSGSFNGDWETQSWAVQSFQWTGNQLVARWIAASDWKPVPPGAFGNGPTFEPVFQPILANDSMYMPGFGGSILRVNRSNGQILERLGAALPLDADTYVSGPLAADSIGNIYYNVIAFSPGQPWTADVRDAWLTKVTPAGQTSLVHYNAITTGTPEATAGCLGAFNDGALPWPPAPGAVPPSNFCGSQRPGVNVAPGIAADGTIYTVSRAHFNSRWSYLVAVNADLSPKWNTSMRDRLNDGCDVLLPPSGTPGGCRSGATRGVDPADNTRGAGRVIDDSSSSPAIAPDGSVFYGAYTRYNYSQGHMMHFSPSGGFLNAYRFGWDITPAIYAHSGTYSLVTKENHYDEPGSYCDYLSICPNVRRADDPHGYFIVQLDPSLNREWSAPNPNDREWCVNGPAIDNRGMIYANSEDGFLYAFDSSGNLRETILLLSTGGAAYTPLAIDDAGRVYAEKGGQLFVAGAVSRRRAVRR
jgi:hypothetical protein